ncbi:hypothetical protein MUN89_05965 [Halobacillus salinarum]|uniref:Uncharacterized protein n=1 Tax=Halobacillus salinarum TaxID=2932257 RepID=A0ABY4EM16_9BACI|nr:hypothetical protein [Halobacillus salinarum]UOQ45490.1 hypothetical protein MUN89_05965 [Halobacillus salinarum]
MGNKKRRPHHAAFPGCRERSQQLDFLFQSRKARQNEMEIVTIEELVLEKKLYALLYCCLRGKEKVKEQALMTAACQNMKKIVLHLTRVR